MPKSKHRSTHKIKLAKYKANKKQEQATFKKKLMENYIKMQQESLQNKEEHTSVEEVVGPEINIDDLNMEWDTNPEQTAIINDEPEVKIIEPVNKIN